MWAKSLLVALVWLGIAGAQAQIQPAFFGMHTNNRGHMPTVAYATMRLWDIGALDWADIDSNCDGIAANYHFANLDATLDAMVAAGVKSLYYTFGHTPSCAAAAANRPPHDLNVDGSGANQHFRSFVRALAEHVHARYPGLITHWETWNEANQAVTWTGTDVQLVRMFEDVHEIVKAVEPAAKVGTPSCVQPSTFPNLAACKTFFNSYFSLKSPQVAGAGPKAADFVAWHPYVHLNVAGNLPQAEDVVVALANVRSALQAQGVSTMPIVASEGGWGNVAVNGYTDPDLHSAFLGKMYLLLAAGAVQSFYWYQWDNGNRGTLWQPTANCNGIMVGTPDAGGYRCPPALAYEQVRSWILHWTPLGPCAVSGTIYTCAFTGPSGNVAQAVWDKAQTCSAGQCTSRNWSPSSAGDLLWRDLDGNTGAVSGNMIAIGAKPIWVQGSSQAGIGTQFLGGVSLLGNLSAQ